MTAISCIIGKKNMNIFQNSFNTVLTENNVKENWGMGTKKQKKITNFHNRTCLEGSENLGAKLTTLCLLK